MSQPMHISIPIKSVLDEVERKREAIHAEAKRTSALRCICFGTDTGPCDFCLDGEEDK